MSEFVGLDDQCRRFAAVNIMLQFARALGYLWIECAETSRFEENEKL